MDNHFSRADVADVPALAVEDYMRLIGSEIGRSAWICIDQAMIDKFADLTGDHQFIHVDPVRAAKSGFGSTIAHGLLTLSLIGALGPKTIPPVKGTKEGVNLGFDRVRFTAPVPSGADIRAVFHLKDIQESKSGQIKQLLGVSVELKGRISPHWSPTGSS